MPDMFILPAEGEWRIVTPEAQAAAQRRDMGELIDVYALTGGISRKKVNRTYEFSRGIVRQEHGQPPEVFHLDDMTEVTAKVTDRTYNGRYEATYFTFTIVCADGRSTTISAYYKSRGDHGHRYCGLGETIREHVAAEQLPIARERIRQGREVFFGDFGLAREGLLWKGKKPVPWERVGPAVVKEGWLTVKLAGGWTKTCIRELGVVPNYAVFRTLLAELRESAPRVG
ncbi:DUF6585 family protein [Streptomyces sp. NPDC049577]|uniref:DUF6585 family protein n=1 Tax=Streptomyces sp. NPDC049577 TaxID=3155153 RepID=UPI00344AA67A